MANIASGIGSPDIACYNSIIRGILTVFASVVVSKVYNGCWESSLLRVLRLLLS